MSVIVTGIDMPKNCVDCRKESTQNVVGIDCSWLDNKNCPLKSIDGLIAKINKQEFTHHNGENHWYMTPSEIKEIVENIIREYCEVQDADSN